MLIRIPANYTKEWVQSTITYNRRQEQTIEDVMAQEETYLNNMLNLKLSLTQKPWQEVTQNDPEFPRRLYASKYDPR